MAADTDEAGPTATIARAAVESDLTDHPDHVVDRTRRCVRDALANALLARETPLGRSYCESVAGSHSNESESDETNERAGGSPVVGGGRVSAVDAAFANAGLVNALDWDDTVEGAGHPGASIVPAALAVAVRNEASTAAFLNAVVVGYETAIRVARALQPTPEQYDLVHGSGTRHAVGAAAAAAALLDIDVVTASEVVGFGAQLAPVAHAGKFGWDGADLTWLKDNAARASTAGVRAASVAGRMRGPRDVLDGDRGFWRMAGSDRCDWDLMATPLGEAYLLPSLSFKPYPCCRWLHAAVEATGRAAEGVEAVTAIEVETAERVASAFVRRPTTQVEAEFSLPFAVGQAAAGRNPVEWYGPHGPAPTPDVEVTASARAEHTERFADERVVPATVTVSGADGTRSTETVHTPSGSPERPLPAGRTDEKLRAGLERAFSDGHVRFETVASTLESTVPVERLSQAVVHS